MEDRDCLSCRLISGFGAIGIGYYIYQHGQKRPGKVERYLMAGLSISAIAVGLMRLCNVQFLKKSNTSQ